MQQKTIGSITEATLKSYKSSYKKIIKELEKEVIFSVEFFGIGESQSSRSTTSLRTMQLAQRNRPITRCAGFSTQAHHRFLELMRRRHS